MTLLLDDRHADRVFAQELDSNFLRHPDPEVLQQRVRWIGAQLGQEAVTTRPEVSQFWHGVPWSCRRTLGDLEVSR